LKKTRRQKSEFRWFEKSEFQWFEAHKVLHSSGFGEHPALNRFTREILDKGYRPVRTFQGDGQQARMLGVKASTYDEAFAALRGTQWEGEPVYGSQGWCSGPLEVEVSRSTAIRREQERREVGAERQVHCSISPVLFAKLEAELKRRGRTGGDVAGSERCALIREAVDLLCSPEGQALSRKRHQASKGRPLDESTVGLKARGA
jgi:hypothetical protein